MIETTTGQNCNAVSTQGTWVDTDINGVEHVITLRLHAYQPEGKVCRVGVVAQRIANLLDQMDGPNSFIVAE